VAGQRGKKVIAEHPDLRAMMNRAG
jgi:hypothetical protein